MDIISTLVQGKIEMNIRMGSVSNIRVVGHRYKSKVR